MLRGVASASSKKLLSQQGPRQKGCDNLGHNIRSCLLSSSSSVNNLVINHASPDASRSREYHNDEPINRNMIERQHQHHGRFSVRHYHQMRGFSSAGPFTSNLNRPNFYHHSSHRWFSAGSDNNIFNDNDYASQSSSPDDEFAASSSSSSSSVDDTLERLFAENQQQDDLQIADALTTALTTSWEPTWYNVADQAVVAVKAFHDLTGIEYGWSIVGVTIIIRLGLFPLMIQSQRTSSRMAHIQPELNQMKARYDAIGSPSRQEQVQFANKVKALFARYEVKPSRAFIAPIVQIPLFMGMFFGLRKMPNIYPDELATGGMFWFENLNNPDPLYILPVLSGLSFFAVIELGKKDMAATMSPQQGQLMVNVFRFMSLGMIPLIAQFDSAMLCYWSANNLLTLGQTALLKQKSVRDYFGIWERPKAVPGQASSASIPSVKEMMERLVKKSRGQATSVQEEMERHNQAVETKKKATRIMDSAREKRRGITGKRNG